MLWLLQNSIMYLVLSSLISLTPPGGSQVQIRAVQEVKASSGFRLMTDTCEVTVARTYNFSGQQRDIRELLTTGTTIEVSLGYNGQLALVFSGYVTGFSGTGPVLIKCEDEMWQLKKGALNKSFVNASLQEVVDYIAPGYDSVVTPVNIGNFEINNATPSTVLKKLSEAPYNLFAYFKAKVLHVGFAYDLQGTNHIIHLQRNTKGDSLEWQNIDESQVQIKAISHVGDGSVLEALYPKDLTGASQRTRNVIGINTVSELEEFAESEHEQLKLDGYAGTIDVFGAPEMTQVTHGDSLEIRDARYPERTGSYLIDRVDVVFNSPSADYKQVLNLGKQI